MQFHVFGDQNAPAILLIHGVMTPWQIWTEQIEHFRKDYCVVVPALNGHEEEVPSEFESLDKEAMGIEEYFSQNFGGKAFAVIGLSMGGAIACRLWERGTLQMDKLVMDGAPLVPYGPFLKSMMTRNYLTIIHRSRQRDPKTLENFKKNFLPERYLESFLKIIDHMSDETAVNMIDSLSVNRLKQGLPGQGKNILYVHGTKMSETLAKKSAPKLKRFYPEATVVCCKGAEHCQLAIYETDRWLHIVEEFLKR